MPEEEYRTYRVEWALEIEAVSPEAAARYARERQLDPDSLATCFTVLDLDNNGEAHPINLFMLDEAAETAGMGEQSYSRHMEGN